MRREACAACAVLILAAAGGSVGCQDIDDPRMMFSLPWYEGAAYTVEGYEGGLIAEDVEYDPGTGIVKVGKLESVRDASLKFQAELQIAQYKHEMGMRWTQLAERVVDTLGVVLPALMNRGQTDTASGPKEWQRLVSILLAQHTGEDPETILATLTGGQSGGFSGTDLPALPNGDNNISGEILAALQEIRALLAEMKAETGSRVGADGESSGTSEPDPA